MAEADAQSSPPHLLTSDPTAINSSATSTTNNAGRTRTLSFAPIAPRTKIEVEPKVSKRRQSKSRNGCVTCKAKRIKCDEAKPTCQTCSRRKVPCGGYKKDIRFKFVGENETSSHLIADKPHPPPGNSKTRSSSENASRPATANSVEHTAAPLETTQPTVAGAASFEEAWPDIRDRPHSAASPFWNVFPSLSPRLVGKDPVFQGAEPDVVAHGYDLSELSDILIPSNAWTDAFGDSLDWPLPDTDLFSYPDDLTQDDIAIQQVDHTTRGQTFDGSLQVSSDWSPLTGHGSVEDSWLQGSDPEVLRQLFDYRTSQILSIRSDNPWRTLIWPLAKYSPALYHAIAAMTFLYMGRSDPQLRDEGMEHMRRSNQALAACKHDEDESLEALLAARLALGFAETWNHEKPSTGQDHIRSAKVLLKQALSQERMSTLSTWNLHCISFLANTWLYMDVIARLTSIRNNNTPDYELISACSHLQPNAQGPQIDPLMGCASGLFPTIGQVADLVSRVRGRTAKRNSPAVISQAIELKLAIQRWTPSIDMEDVQAQSDNPTASGISDSIQTAEAYRCATLLLLRQAVPELPDQMAWWDLAQKVLVFLATIPITSRTVIVHIFPLMVAGCEAVEDEDREWVRQRWDDMAKRMITGIVDRCAEVTEEVWKRRDAHGISSGVCHVSGRPSGRLSPGEGAGANSTQSSCNRAACNVYTGCVCSPEVNTRSEPSDFPDSAAFKKGADRVTRAGSLDYTVKGKLHWLGVMEDWNWEVMLG